MQRILIIVLVLVVVLAFMVTYVVRFNESAVVSTFGSADEKSVVTTPGLGFKLPYPFQKITTYDNRVRFIQADQETQQTADNRQVILSTFLTWKVSNPLKFYLRFGGAGETSAKEHYREAEKILKTKLRAAAGAVSQFQVAELVSAEKDGSKLPALEDAMLKALSGTGTGDSALSAYGIEPVAVGVAGLGLPSDTTRAVFEHMKAARLKIANEVSARGGAEASQITSAAEANARKIQDFAQQLATSIRSQGDIEAVQFLSQMKQDPQLAVFIQNMEFMRRIGGRRTTLVLPTTMPGFEFFRPDAGKKFGGGRPPSIDVQGIMKDKPRSGIEEPAATGTLIAEEGR